MRFVQKILLIVGLTALSTIVGVFAVGAAVALVQRPGGEPWTRGFGQYIGGLVCGAPLGALCGFGGSVAFVLSQDDDAPWPLPIWGGILLGLLAGVALSVSWGLNSGNQWWIVVALVATTTATLGGFVTYLALAMWRTFKRSQ